MTQLRLDPEIEAQFSHRQRPVRRETFEYLTRKVNGKDQIDMDMVLIKSCPKVTQGFDQNNFKRGRVYRGTNFRGVSLNGRCNWQILTMIDG